MDSLKFLQCLQSHTGSFAKEIATDAGDWVVKGFIDVHRRVYTISVDTKVVSKVLELLLFPTFKKFAEDHNLTVELSPEQNCYPDLTFIDKETGKKFAVDIKSTYIAEDGRVNGFTLGAFTGYFRNRNSQKNTLYPYKEYSGHFVLGVIYSQAQDATDERQIHSLDELEAIPSVIKGFQFFAQPKYKIASTTPGSGNTKNIGSIKKIKDILEGKGPFAELGEEIYDDYWMFYLTKLMAKEAEIERPYMNLKTYFEYKKRGLDVLERNATAIAALDEDDNEVNEEVD